MEEERSGWEKMKEERKDEGRGERCGGEEGEAA